jgi:predicted MFS family arabinose efflux permease
MTSDTSARRTILVLSVCGFASTFAIRFVDPMVGEISRDLARPTQDVALLASAFALPYALIQPVLGPIGDAFGKERVMKACLLVLTVSLALSTVTPDFGPLLALRVISGAAGGGIIPLVLATIGDRVPMAERQVAIGRFLLFNISGQLLGGTVAGLLASWTGWRLVFGLAAFLAGLAAAAVAFAMPKSPKAAGRFSIALAASRYAGLLRMSRARALYMFVFFEGGIVFGVQPFIAPLLEERGRGGPTEAGLIIAGFALGGIAYTLAVGAMLRILGLRLMLVTGGVLGFAAYAVLAFGPIWPVQAAAMLLIGTSFYMLHNSFQTQTTELTSEARASAVSLHAFSFFTGQSLGAPVVGAGLLHLGLTPTMLLCGLGMATLGVVSAAVLTRPQRAL